MCVLLANEYIHTNLVLEVNEVTYYKIAIRERKNQKKQQTQNRRISQAAY